MKSNNPRNDLWADYKSPVQPNKARNKSARPKSGVLHSKLSPSGSLKKARSTNTSVGAVRAGNPDRKGLIRHWLGWTGVALVTGGGAIYAANSVQLQTQEPVATTSFKQAVLTKKPKPLPTPTFRFDDAEAVQSSESALAQSVIRHKPGSSNAFAPMAFAELLQSKDSEQEIPALTIAAITEAQSDLPPLTHTLPQQELTPQQDKPQLQDNYKEVVVVKAGDTLSRILNDRGVSKNDLPLILQHDLIQRFLTKLKIDQKLEFILRWDGVIHELSVKVNRDTRIIVKTADDGYRVHEMHLPLEYERVVTSGTIEQSLYLAAERAQLKQSTIMTLADIFQWELDFSHDIRKGDDFSIVYDRLYRDGKYIGDGEILAAEFLRGDRVHRAIRFTDDDGKTGYYSPDGQSKRKSFMRHPVDVVRITSKFDPNRVHPVLHKIRAHKGVDYGAPHGSPIKAVADGRISYSGKRNAYGNTVIIKHDKTRTTLYAHMSEIHARSQVGKKVRQGDIIGYVGRTGRVTGTHLHYELRIKGKHVDPLKVELPVAEALPSKYSKKLKAISNELLAQMRSVTENIEAEQVATKN